MVKAYEDFLDLKVKGFKLRVVFSAGHLRSIAILDDYAQGAKGTPQNLAHLGKRPAWLKKLMYDLKAYFEGEEVDFSWVPIADDELTDFQRQVLQVCRGVQRGRAVTYGAIAAQLRRPRAARAVGQALRRNPFLFVVPCHRVVGQSGELCGYQGRKGIRVKDRLLKLEKARRVVGKKK